jgi:hypothetical protein
MFMGAIEPLDWPALLSAARHDAIAPRATILMRHRIEL